MMPRQGNWQMGFGLAAFGLSLLAAFPAKAHDLETQAEIYACPLPPEGRPEPAGNAQIDRLLGDARDVLSGYCFDEALPMVERALALAEASDEPVQNGFDRIADSLEALAKVQRLRGDLDAAQAALTRAEERRRSFFEHARSDPEFSGAHGAYLFEDLHTTRTSLANMLELKRDFRAAHELLRRSVADATGEADFGWRLKIEAVSELARFLMRHDEPEMAGDALLGLDGNPFGALGFDHPTTVSYTRLIIASLLLAGDQDNAMKWIENLQDGMVEIHGIESGQAIRATQGLTDALINRGRVDEAADLSLRIASRLDSKFEAEGNRLNPMSLSQLLVAVNDLRIAERYPESDGLLVNVLQLARRLHGEDFNQQASGFLMLAASASRQDRFDFAERVLVRLQEVYDSGNRGDAAWLRLAKAGHASVALQTDQIGKATRLNREMREMRGGGVRFDNEEEIITARIALANEDYEDAEFHARRALDIVRKNNGEFDPEMATAFAMIGEVMIAEGRHKEAAELLLPQAGSIAVRDGSKVERRRFRLVLGEAMLGAPDYHFAIANPAAEVWMETLEDLLARDGSDSFAIESIARDLGGLRKVSHLSAEFLWQLYLAAPETRDVRERAAFEALQYAGANELDLTIDQAARRATAERKGPEFAALVERREAVQREWSALYERMFETIDDLSEENELDRMDVVLGMGKLDKERREIDARLSEAIPEYSTILLPEVVALEDVPALLNPDEAVLLLAAGPRGVHTMAVTREGQSWNFAALPEDELVPMIRSLQWDIGAFSELDEDDPVEWFERPISSFDTATANRLYRELIAPVEATLAGKRRVFVVSTGSISALPLSILTTRQANENLPDAQKLRETEWLSDRYDFTVLPALTALASSRAEVADSGLDRFLGIGHPQLAPLTEEQLASMALIATERSGRRTARGTRSAGMARIGFDGARGGQKLANPQDLRRMTSLPGTEIELQRMAEALNTPSESLLMQSRATEGNFKNAQLSGLDVLTIATHGLLASEAGPLAQPGLVFTPPETASERDDGYLTPQEIAQLTIEAKWVILSACNTAGGGGDSGGEGLTGLARAFFYAGSENLLISHWPVLDEVAPVLTVLAVTAKRDNPDLTYGEALGQAMVAVREDTRRDDAQIPWSHPRAWAPFSVIAAGAN